MYNVPAGAAAWIPQVHLHDPFVAQSSAIYIADHGMHREVSPQDEPRLVMPFSLSCSFHTTASVLQLRVDDWDSYEYLPLPVTAEAMTASNNVVVVLPPLYNVPPEDAAQLIAVNVQYHQALGLKSLVYVAPPYMQAYSGNPCIANMETHQQLRLVLWDMMPASIRHPYGYKPLVYSYALLSSWGTNDVLLMLDVDEFVIVPEAKSGPLVHIESCIAGLAQAVAYRCDTVLSSTQYEPDYSFWRTGGQCSFHVLSQYGAVADCHQMTAGKSFVNSSAVSAFAVHSGHVATGRESDIDPDCLSVLHVVNLLTHRVNFSHSLTKVQHWKWVFKE